MACSCFCSRKRASASLDNTRVKLLPTQDGDILPKTEEDYTLLVHGAFRSQAHLTKQNVGFFGGAVKKLACGQDHFLILSAANFVLASGNNSYGQCGPIRDTDFIQTVTRILPPNMHMRFTDVAAGRFHSLFLAEDSASTKVLALGHSVGNGFLPHSDVFVEVPLPAECVSERVTKVFAGYMKSVAVVGNDQLYCWGEWHHCKRYRRMKRVPTQERVKKVALGNEFALLLTRDQKVLSWGDNSYGELGFPSEVHECEVPTLIPFFGGMNILDIATGARHAIVLESTGRVFCFGDNSEGQCAIDTQRAVEPQEIHSRGLLTNKEIRTRFIWAGDAHSALYTNQGDLYVWGDNTADRLGAGPFQSVFSPKLIEEMLGRNVVAVGLGGVFSIILLGPFSNSLLNSSDNQLVKNLVLGSMQTLLRGTSFK